jgi:hypothetical protein
MSERVEVFQAKYTAVSFDDGGDVGESLYFTAGTGTAFEITGTQAELVKFATDLIEEMMLKGDVG